MRQTKRDRIGSGGERQLVHEGLSCEHVGVGAQCPQRGHPDRHVLDEMVHDLLVRKLVERDRIAVAAAGRLRRRGRRTHRLRLGQIPGGEHVRARGRLRPRRMRVAPHVVVPVDDAAFGIERGLRLHRHRGTERLPGELVVAHPLQPHRFARHRAREQRGVERDVVGAVVAVAAGAFGVDAADLRRRHLQRLHQLAAQREHALRMGPDRVLVVLEFRDRGRGADRGMRHVGLGVGRLEDFRRARQQRRLLVADRLHLGGQRLQVLEQPRRIGQVRARLPLRGLGERRARLDGLLLALGDDAEERAVAHHRDHALDRLRLGVVHRDQRRAVVRRTHHAAMHHAGQAQVLHVGRLAGDLAGNIEARDRLADDLVHSGRFRPHGRGRLALEVERRGKLAVADSSCRSPH